MIYIDYVAGSGNNTRANSLGRVRGRGPGQGPRPSRAGVEGGARAKDGEADPNIVNKDIKIIDLSNKKLGDAEISLLKKD